MNSDATKLLIEVSPGELLDKISILEIKRQRLLDPAKLRHIEDELAALATVARGLFDRHAAVPALFDELKALNETLWDIEDAIRLCERAQDFGERFIAMARRVYKTNDRRAALKRRLNEALGSRLMEEKQYQAYEADAGDSREQL